jgi:hypothetical protein
MTIGTASGYGLGLGTRSARGRVFTPTAPHKSYTGNALILEHPSPNRSADMLAEDDITTSEIASERVTKQVQFDQRLSIFARPVAQISKDCPFSRARTTRASLSSNFSEPPCSVQPSNSPVGNIEIQLILRFEDSFSKRLLRSVLDTCSSWERVGPQDQLFQCG